MRLGSAVALGFGSPERVLCSSCSGRDGKPKVLYASAEEATRAAAYERSSRGVALRVYGCPRGRGWHLTKCTP